MRKQIAAANWKMNLTISRQPHFYKPWYPLIFHLRKIILQSLQFPFLILKWP